MKMPVQLPYGTMLGLVPPMWLQRYLELTQAGAASAVHELYTLSIAQVGTGIQGAVPEDDYVPFTITKYDGNRGLKAT